jgi:subtilase family serine protease
MRSKMAFNTIAPVVVAIIAGGCSGDGHSPVPGAEGRSVSSYSLPIRQMRELAIPVCPQVIGKPTCLALIAPRTRGGAAVEGWTPGDIQARYNLPSTTNGSGQVVAIVDGFDNPHVASDLATYRKRFGLGKAEFQKYNQEGQQGAYPSANDFWGLEIDLDVEMVSATCPKCTIYLVEANSGAPSDLEAAEAEAVSLGAHIVSNSWNCYASNTCVGQSYFDAPGVIYTAGSGDYAYDYNGAPESLASVVSVGGTVLSRKGSKYNEVVADFAGGGCSDNGGGSGAVKPSWQTDPDCAFRTDADVAAVAWNVAEYDSYKYRGWFPIGGTSVATPIIASTFALAGNASTQTAGEAFWTMGSSQRRLDLHAIARGENGSCGGEYLCTAGTKQFGTYSGPAGWGTPNGIGAF